MEIALVICLVAAVAASDLAGRSASTRRSSCARSSRRRRHAVSADVISQAAHAGGRAGHHDEPRAARRRTPQASDASLAGRQQLIDQRLGEVQTGVRTDIDRLSQLVQPARARPPPSASARSTARCRSTPRSPRRCRPPPTACARRWPARTLAASGASGWPKTCCASPASTSGVNYHKRTAVVGEGTGIPDFTFLLPKGHVLFMDVKFPMAVVPQLPRRRHRGRAIGAPGHVRARRPRPGARAGQARVRQHRRPARRSTTCCCSSPTRRSAPSSTRATTALIDEAMRQNVVICSPLTLFAFLGVIRQAFDNFVIEQTSQEILQLLGKFGQQWGKYTESVDKVKRQFDTRQPIVRRAGHHPTPGARTAAQRHRGSAPQAAAADRRPAVRGRRRPSDVRATNSTTCANSAPDGPDFAP